MSKTPEEMAEEWAEDNDECCFARDAFLAGYQAARDQSPDATKWIEVTLDGSNNNIEEIMETMNDKNRIEAVIEMLEEHLDDICKAGLSEEGTDSLLHRPSYVLNMLRFFNEQQKTQES